jgi:hypothetical protein
VPPTPPRDISFIRKRVQKWRTSTPDSKSWTQSHPSQEDSDVDIPFIDEKVTTDMNNYRPLSPPPSNSPTPPLTMDTDQLIARIKAEIVAVTSPEQDISLDMSMDSSNLSSDEDGDKDVFGLKKSSRGKNLQKTKETNLSPAPVQSRRSRRLMDHSPSLSDPVSASANASRPARMSRPRRAPNRELVVSTSGYSSKSLRRSNPLTKILKDHQKDKTNGCGTEAILATEELVASRPELREDFEDIDDLLNMTSLEVGTSSLPDVATRLNRDHGSQSSRDPSISEARVEKLLGAKEGQAVGKILNRDRGNRPKKTTAVGIELFNPMDDVPQDASPKMSSAAGLQTEDISDIIFNILKNAVNAKGMFNFQLLFPLTR